MTNDYKWDKYDYTAVKTPTLRAEGRDNVLLFHTPDESAHVYLNDFGVDKVVHFDVHGAKSRTIAMTEAHHIVRGEDNEARDVYHFLTPNKLPLRLGLTVHRKAGGWSSTPHPFELTPEPGFEEIFFFVLNDPWGRAVSVRRGMWHDGTFIDRIDLVRSHMFSTIPMGYHPVGSEPGVFVSYVWAYLAKKKEWEKI